MAKQLPRTTVLDALEELEEQQMPSLSISEELEEIDEPVDVQHFNDREVNRNNHLYPLNHLMSFFHV